MVKILMDRERFVERGRDTENRPPCMVEGGVLTQGASPATASTQQTIAAGTERRSREQTVPRCALCFLVAGGLTLTVQLMINYYIQRGESSTSSIIWPQTLQRFDEDVSPSVRANTRQL